MKLIIGIVRPERANDVLEALFRADVRGVSISRIQVTAASSSASRPTAAPRSRWSSPRRCASRSRSPRSSSSRRSRRSARAAAPAEVGDGMIFVLDLEGAVRIRTGEADHGAVTPVSP